MRSSNETFANRQRSRLIGWIGVTQNLLRLTRWLPPLVVIGDPYFSESFRVIKIRIKKMFNDDPDNFVIGKVRKFDVIFRKT